MTLILILNHTQKLELCFGFSNWFPLDLHFSKFSPHRLTALLITLTYWHNVDEKSII
jgi:hypothetical protein